MERHPELQPVYDPEFGDIFDALELAFIDTPLADCTLDDLPFGMEVTDFWCNSKIREKRAYDTTVGGVITVTHSVFDVLESNTFTQRNFLAIDWADASSQIMILLVDLADKSIALGTVETPAKDFVATDIETASYLKGLTKQLLGSVTDVY